MIPQVEITLMSGYKTIKELMADINAGKKINGYFFLAHYLNIRNRQIARLKILINEKKIVARRTERKTMLRIKSPIGMDK